MQTLQSGPGHLCLHSPPISSRCLCALRFEKHEHMQLGSQNHSPAPSGGAREVRSPCACQQPPAATSDHQGPPATTISHHQPPGTTISHHRPPVTTRGHQRPPAATSHHQGPPRTTISHHWPPVMTSGHHRPPVTTSSHQGPPAVRATHSNILAWKIPWTEEHGRLQSMVLQRVRHN